MSGRSAAQYGVQALGYTLDGHFDLGLDGFAGGTDQPLREPIVQIGLAIPHGTTELAVSWTFAGYAKALQGRLSQPQILCGFGGYQDIGWHDWVPHNVYEAPKIIRFCRLSQAYADELICPRSYAGTFLNRRRGSLRHSTRGTIRIRDADCLFLNLPHIHVLPRRNQGDDARRSLN